MKQMNIQRAQKGFTLIELSFVLIAIGLLIGGALAGASYLDGVKANNDAAAIQRVIANLQQKYARVNSTSGVSTSNAVTGRIFESSSWSVDTAAGLVYNQFNGPVSVASSTILYANDGFKMVTDNVPVKVCQKLVPLLSQMVYRVDIGTVTVQANPTATPSPAAIDTECDKGTGAAQTKISLYFLRKP